MESGAAATRTRQKSPRFHSLDAFIPCHRMLARVALRASRAVAAAAIVPRIAVVPSLPVRAFAAAAAAAGTPAFIVFDETQHKLDDIVTKPDAKVVAYFTAR